jgi:GNAT superfamily N-acetyltransferase
MRAPERLTPEHDVSQFSNGRHDALDDWLRARALASEGLSARTYVLCEDETSRRVIGYYALSTTKEQRIALPTAKLRKGMPEEIPLLLLGRLAIDAAHQGRGIGGFLLRDALLRCLATCEIVGARAIATHAIDDAAAEFYKRHGFVPALLGDRTLLLPVETLRATIV